MYSLPFIEAVEKMKMFYTEKKLDHFKDGVSLPGLVLKCLIKALIVSFIYLGYSTRNARR
jgi:hypothetical protein